MPPFIQDLQEKVTSLWSSSSVPQRILVAGLGLSVIAAFAFLMFFITRPDYRVLSSDLYPEDASRVVEILESENVRYQLEDDGTTILVPADQVHKMRLAISGEGVLRGEGMGFELFDDTGIGQTDFVQNVNYQRALQGELARTISEFSEVEHARVHLVMPERSLFIEEETPPSASIVLQLRSGQRLESSQIQSIVNLVVTGVEGMDSDRVTISDTSGRVLYEPQKDLLDGMSSTQLEYQLNFQRDLERRIEHMLTPFAGPGRVIAKVNADLDFDRRTTRQEIFDPDGSVVRSEQRSTEESSGGTFMEEGVPEPDFQQGFEGPATTQETSRSDRTTNFEISREEHNIVASVGSVDRLSVAVLVDGQHVTDDAGEMVYEPLADEEMQRIQQLVERAVGFDQERGDSIEVSSVDFGAPEVEPEPTLMDNLAQYFQTFGKPLLNALLVLLFLLLVVRPIIMTILKPKVAEEEGEEAEGLPEGGEREALAPGMSEEEVEGMQDQKRVEGIKVFASQLAEENFDQAFAVVKKWLKEERV
ncbi:flagellar M-ring protein FliF [Desulfonatronospira thiodismutans ASO3-1]|uniref:Flagellar M-ring protein n=1 Tax=Desulfonatronospira thiodismutans ASO3-1 TaxID=555779 RepID=D6STA5_9BACT|nr:MULTISPECIES: flagellar basal-body MS-ring/collar protein FliF [Desulfonatronospira]EFI33921.1 flagellar M-ring protein FliF [Desulfonatronospira thiodismutans ASO3-1]